MLFSAADPELHELAINLRKLVPENSVLNTKLVGRIIGVLKSIIETKAEGMPPVIGAVIEKLTDLSDTFAGGEKHSGEHKTEKIVDDWMMKMFHEAGERLKKSTEPEKEAEKIKKEFAARMDILHTIEQAMAAKQSPEHEHPSTHEPMQIGKVAKDLINQWKASASSRGYTGRR